MNLKNMKVGQTFVVSALNEVALDNYLTEYVNTIILVVNNTLWLISHNEYISCFEDYYIVCDDCGNEIDDFDTEKSAIAKAEELQENYEYEKTIDKMLPIWEEQEKLKD